MALSSSVCIGKKIIEGIECPSYEGWREKRTFSFRRLHGRTKNNYAKLLGRTITHKEFAFAPGAQPGAARKDDVLMIYRVARSAV